MLNTKKFKMAFKRYSKNFNDGIRLEHVEKKYKKNKSEIINIVEMNDIEKDHILLIDLSSIGSYYLSKWKNDVLINGGNRIEQLKKVQMVVFYQCMVQDVYKTRYPNMMPEYTFREVITALIHFTLFGWEKEEAILFEFIVDHIDENKIDANDWNKHIWFLLELYLQYRNKTIAGTNQKLHLAVKEKFQKLGLQCDLIPEELDIYREVLERWSTCNVEELRDLINKMSLFHSILASEIGQSLEFGDFKYAFYPFEILFLIHVRNKLGLSVPKQFDDLLMNTPEAKMSIGDPEIYSDWDPLLHLIDIFYRKNYPGYIPNKHGELFK
ncbi:hypothetical protein LL037_14785 [Clostridium estertheticum]|uniref:hypothetical protein n=1 Tax=Clostridium estertheticum TaxID=238834 RepID=UPI00209B14B6|nr:hypothetical protein [Clostridium estertheticum]WAG63746.1 hypothetical protein LL037_14785 [Clostridium estertheticum]